MSSLPLDAGDRHLLSYVDGWLGEQDLAFITGKSLDAVQADLARLVEAGHVVLVEPGRSHPPGQRRGAHHEAAAARAPGGAAAGDTPAGDPPKTPASEGSPAADGVELSAEERRAIDDFHARLPGISDHDLLGVTAEATTSDVRKAYNKLARRFHPDRHFRKKLGPYKHKIEEIFGRLTVAHDELRASRRHQGRTAPPPSPSPEPVPTPRSPVAVAGARQTEGSEANRSQPASVSSSVDRPASEASSVSRPIGRSATPAVPTSTPMGTAATPAAAAQLASSPARAPVAGSAGPAGHPSAVQLAGDPARTLVSRAAAPAPSSPGRPIPRVGVVTADPRSATAGRTGPSPGPGGGTAQPAFPTAGVSGQARAADPPPSDPAAARRARADALARRLGMRAPGRTPVAIQRGPVQPSVRAVAPTPAAAEPAPDPPPTEVFRAPEASYVPVSPAPRSAAESFRERFDVIEARARQRRCHTHVAEAISALSRGDYAVAAEAYRKAAELAPEDAALARKAIEIGKLALRRRR